MKFFKPKTLVPMDRKTFLDGTIKYYFVSLISVMVILYLFYSHFKIEYVACAGLVYAVVTTFFVKYPSYSGRLKDLYPDHKPNQTVICFFHLIPLLYIPFTIFLCLKEKSEGAVPSKIFYKNSYFSLIAIPLIAFGLISSQMAYWFAGPSTYYLADFVDKSIKVVSFKEKVEKLNIQGSPIDYYMKDKAGLTSSNELVLLAAVSMTLAVKEFKRAPASDSSQKNIMSIENSIKLLQENNKIIAIGENREFKLSAYSPLHWISVIGLLEIGMLSVVDMKMQQELLVTSVTSFNQLLQGLEVRYSKLPPETQSLYKSDLMKVTKDLRGSKTFRSLASFK
jgi:hypothetical protein